MSASHASTRLAVTPHGTKRLVHAMSAWLVKKTRRAPSRYRNETRAYGLKSTAMHETSPPPRSPCWWIEESKLSDEFHSNHTQVFWGKTA